MARLPRLALAGRVHYGIQRGTGARPVFVDDTDRLAFIALLHEAAVLERVTLHAWALQEHEVQWLATPAEAAALGRMVQAVGRRYVGAYNRRHGGQGTLWAGRFRCGVVAPGPAVLASLVLVDGQAGTTTAGCRIGTTRDARVVDPPEFWHLGNTPFEREARYRALLSQGLPSGEAAALRRAALGGWAVGALRHEETAAPARPLRPRPRGRPAKR